MRKQNNRTLPIVFISYAWENENHEKWVINFANKLKKKGIDVKLDKEVVKFGDRLPQFMEGSIANADYVLIICTPLYKEKADKRIGGVGYEGNIITGEIFDRKNERKFIPILKEGDSKSSIPNFCLGKRYVDLSGDSFQAEFSELVATIKSKYAVSTIEKAQENEEFKDIHIMKILKDEITKPKLDGTRGCNLYSVSFQLSSIPSESWIKAFLKAWNCPPKFSSVHRPNIAHVEGAKIILNGTTIDEVQKYHKETLTLCVEIANKEEEKKNQHEMLLREEKEKKLQEHEQHINDLEHKIIFN